MSRILRVILWGAVAVTILGGPAQAQEQAKPPPFATTKVEGTDNVYIFRYGNHQAMFVVTRDGVIATDPIGYGRPQAVTTYVDEIKKVTDKPIRYLIYSHHHYDHIAGGKPFKDAGATFIAHKRAKERLAVSRIRRRRFPMRPMDKKRTITLGGTTLELTYVGLNHSDSSIVMRLPKEKIIFAVDLLSGRYVAGPGHDRLLSARKLGRLDQASAGDGLGKRLIPGHPGAPDGRLGTKKDVQDVLTFLQDASAAVKTSALRREMLGAAEKEMKLPKYANWPNYQAAMPFVLMRSGASCGTWMPAILPAQLCISFSVGARSHESLRRGYTPDKVPTA